MIAGSSGRDRRGLEHVALAVGVLPRLPPPRHGGPTAIRALNAGASANLPVLPARRDRGDRAGVPNAIGDVALGEHGDARNRDRAELEAGGERDLPLRDRGSITTTRSPPATPRAASRFATRLLARATSSKVSRRSLPRASHHTSASFDGSRAQASTTSVPKLNAAGVSSRCSATARS